MKDFVVYTLLRALLFVATLAIVAGIWLALAGNRINWFLALLVSLVISGLASYVLLNGQRARFAQRVEEKAARAAAAFEANRGKED